MLCASRRMQMRSCFADAAIARWKGEGPKGLQLESIASSLTGHGIATSGWWTSGGAPRRHCAGKDGAHPLTLAEGPGALEAAIPLKELEAALERGARQGPEAAAIVKGEVGNSEMLADRTRVHQNERFELVSSSDSEAGADGIGHRLDDLKAMRYEMRAGLLNARVEFGAKIVEVPSVQQEEVPQVDCASSAGPKAAPKGEQPTELPLEKPVDVSQVKIIEVPRDKPVEVPQGEHETRLREIAKTVKYDTQRNEIANTGFAEQSIEVPFEQTVDVPQEKPDARFKQIAKTDLVEQINEVPFGKTVDAPQVKNMKFNDSAWKSWQVKYDAKCNESAKTDLAERFSLMLLPMPFFPSLGMSGTEADSEMAMLGLAGYCLTVDRILQEAQLRDLLECGDEVKVGKAVQDTLHWLDQPDRAGLVELEGKEPEPEGITNPTLMKAT
ncbi:unnamed protein product [Prorocentrum cordatum]|uniref:Uncharacterized protein n=1 Tax=Prorocentrum cordatum TaxID=2364126 RepID=A0ABN9S499_9DINO|nr:unnamed protein product [Polarella glacialis]